MHSEPSTHAQTPASVLGKVGSGDNAKVLGPTPFFFSNQSDLSIQLQRDLIGLNNEGNHEYTCINNMAKGPNTVA